MTMGYQSTYGTFYNLSIIVSDFISMISLEDKVKSGQKLYLFEKKKKLAKLKNPMGKVQIQGIIGRVGIAHTHYCVKQMINKNQLYRKTCSIL